MKKFLVILSIIAIVVGVYFSSRNSNFHIKKLVTISVGEEVPTVKSYLGKDVDIDITWKDLELEDGKVYHVGTYEGVFSYEREEYAVKVEVKDTISPTITGVEDITITVGDSIDLWSKIRVSDNSKDELKKEIKGEYDIRKVGEYFLSYVVSDLGGNQKEENFTLIVKEGSSENASSGLDFTRTTTPAKVTTKGYPVEVKNGVYYIDGTLIANKTYDLPSTYNPGELLTEFLNHYNEMKQDAASIGIYYTIISGYRDYETQDAIYRGYVERDGQKEADRYSARPGHSEHQSGLAADLNSLYQSWGDTEEGIWLSENCARYGFIIRYPKGKESITGYMYEPWHIRYVGVELAEKLYQDGTWSTLEEYFGITSAY